MSEPPRLFPPGREHVPHHQHSTVRRNVVIAYWVIVLITLPLWYKTTHIERLSLPRESIKEISSLKSDLRFPVQLNIALAADSPIDASAFAASMDSRLSTKELLTKKLLVTTSSTAPSTDETYDRYTIDLSTSSSVNQIEYEVFGRSLRVRVPLGKSAEAVATELADVVAELLDPTPDAAFKLRVMQYAPRYRLAFSLLNEDASLGGGVLGWDVETGLKGFLEPTLRALSHLHNFTVESQVQFHAPLAFEPEHISEGPWVINDDNLKVFVNSAEWTLASSAANDPIIHFLLFIPSVDRRPLRISDSDGQLAASNAFILPQWGGIYILNPSSPDGRLTAPELSNAFRYFDTQLRALLGVPSLPPQVSLDRTTTITGWQIDALLRRRALENVANSIDTTNSIILLIDKITRIPVHQPVRSDLTEAVAALAEIRSESNSYGILRSSVKALTRSSAAFFNPNMLASLYFPIEHEYAVYTPLFAPVAVPLLVSLVKEVRAWMEARRAGKTKME